MGRRKKLVNHSGIPQHALEAIARCVWPDIQASFNSEEGQRMFAEWEAEQGAKNRLLLVKKFDMTKGPGCIVKNDVSWAFLFYMICFPSLVPLTLRPASFVACYGSRFP